MNQRLSDKTLPLLATTVRVPAYDRAAVTAGVVHLGVGAFHRCHQAVTIDDCLAGDGSWGIVGASLRSPDTRDALEPQDGLYTLAIRSGAGEELRVVGSMVQLLVAPEDPAALLDVLGDPAIRIVTLTVTEKAYLRGADGGLDKAHPDIRHDLAHPQTPRTAHGFLVEALARRFAAGIAPFTILCCDNLPANGSTVRRVLLDFATLRDAGLAARIAETVAFPSSMVDRIVPATTDADRARISDAIGLTDAWPVVTEPFTQWVVEDHFSAGRPDWERFGVEMVEDVKPFEDMKLRLLNGSHSAIAYLGLLSGLATVDKAFSDPAIRRFVARLWQEAIPTLPGTLDASGYTVKLAERFGNPALAHQTKQIAMDGSQKLPQRIIATALECLRAGTQADHLTLVPAAWIACCEARGGTLPAGHFTDPLDAPLGALFERVQPAGETVAAVFELAGFAHGNDLRPILIKMVAEHLARLRNNGVMAALDFLEGRES